MLIPFNHGLGGLLEPVVSVQAEIIIPRCCEVAAAVDCTAAVHQQWWANSQRPTTLHD